jgi:aspartate/tyrosine/aromatic aminotransferase
MEICDAIKKKRLFPFFDFAYQGFGDGLEKDASILPLFLKNGVECAIAVSHAKNFGIYGERCGALFFICQNENAAERIGSHIKVIIRGMYSSPPCHGARIVSTILQNSELKVHWEHELLAMRQRIAEMRAAFGCGLQTKISSSDFNFLATQKGMFSYTGLNEQQVDRLMRDYGIYLPKDGRINVAGLNSENLEYVTDAILAVWR